MTEIVRLYNRSGDNMEPRADVAPDGRLIRGDENEASILVEFLEERGVDEALEYLNGPHLLASAIDVEDLDYDPGLQEKSDGCSYLITEPRLGVVGKYEPGGTFEYEGAHSAVETILKMGDPSDLSETPASLVPRTRREGNLMKQAEDTWIPYQGPEGGEGWQHVATGEVRYQQDPPGEVHEEYRDDHWRDQWPDLEDGEWQDEVPSYDDVDEGDLALFVNRDGASEVASVERLGFVRDEEWDSAKMGVILEDGRRVPKEDVVAYADMSESVDPPELRGDREWEDAPGAWNEYETGDLVYYETEDGEARAGVVESRQPRETALKVEDREGIRVVDADKVHYRSDVAQGEHAGYEAIDSPFDDVPELDSLEKPPDRETIEEYGLTVDDVRGVFDELGPFMLGQIEETIRDGPYDPADPADYIEAATEVRDEERFWRRVNSRLRGQAAGVSMNRAQRIVDEAFGDLPSARSNVRDYFGEYSTTDDPERWLEAAADYAADDDWADLASLQDAIDDWTDGVGIDPSGVHGFDGEPEEIVPLSETGSNTGISAGAMFLAEWEDGKRAYVTRVSEVNRSDDFIEEAEDAERAMTGYHVQGALNDDNNSIEYPDHEYHPDEFFSVEGVEGAELADDFEDTDIIDKSDFMDLAASALIAGNQDLHAKNVMVDEEGTLYPIDLDYSGFDLTDEGALGRAIDQLGGTASSLGIEASEEYSHHGDPDNYNPAKRPLSYEILDHVQNFAEERSRDELVSANPGYKTGGMDENVIRNFEAAKRGDLDL